MRNTLLDPYEHLPRSVVVTANDYPAGSTFPAHTHLRGQFMLARRHQRGDAARRWLVPPRRACWLPADMAHEMTMNGPVTMLNAFIARLPRRRAPAGPLLRPWGVALLRLLLDQAVDLPALYDVEGRDGKLMALLVAEIAAMPRLHLHAPLPEDPRLARACLRLFAAPSIGASLDEMAADAGMSRRTFTRLFRAQPAPASPRGGSRSACRRRSRA